jgi:hypothetical protein
MTLRCLEEVFFAEPFKPFTIHTADGREFSVPHPEFLSFTSSKWLIIVFEHDGSRNFLDLELVTTLRFART